MIVKEEVMLTHKINANVFLESPHCPLKNCGTDGDFVSFVSRYSSNLVLKVESTAD